MGVKQVGGLRISKSPGLDRVDLAVEEFNQLIKTKGYNATWEKAMFCPSLRGVDPKDHDIACTICDGSGFIFYDSMLIRVLMQSLAIDEQYFAYGRFDSGKVTATPQSGHELSFWDKLILCESVVRFAELIHRRPSTLFDRPKYNIVELINIMWVDRTDTLVTYEIDVDVSYDDTSGELEWLTSNRPDDGDWYSAAYRYHPEYQVIDMGHAVRDTQVSKDGTFTELSRQAVAQLRWMIRDEGKDTDGQDKPVNPFKL